MMSYDYPHPVSRTYQYKKITKPLLERKRRARINRCLDELKDLMVDALETEGENISKLEKADILELTVRHLQRLQASRPSGLSTSAVPGEDTSESRWRSGFGHCAAEACRFLAALPGEAADRLARHLASGLQVTRQLDVQVSQKISSPPLSPITSRSALASPGLAGLEKTANALVPTPSSRDGDCQSSACGLSLRTTAAHPYASPRNCITDRVAPQACKSAASLRSRTIEGESSIGASDILPSKMIPLIPNEKPTSEGHPKDKGKPATTNGQPFTDEDEEIDVENLDESDPMWRPW